MAGLPFAVALNQLERVSSSKHTHKHTPVSQQVCLRQDSGLLLQALIAPRLIQREPLVQVASFA